MENQGLADWFDRNHPSGDEVKPEVDLSSSLDVGVFTADNDQVDRVGVAEKSVVGRVVRFHAGKIPDAHVTSRYAPTHTHHVTLSTGMLTRPGKSEAEIEAEAKCHEAEARHVV